MVNHLNFKDEKVFIISDLHYRHNPAWEIPIWKQRGFNSSAEHDDAIIKNHNNVVTNNDICIFLGDSVVGAGGDSTKVFKSLFSTLNYKEAYIAPGNHWAGYRTLMNDALQYGEQIDKYYRLLIKEIVGRTVYFIPNYYEILSQNRLFVLSHYPVLSWRDINKNSLMCHGHSHSNLHKTDWIENNYYKGNVIDLSWDCYKKPLTTLEIIDILKDNKILKIDHH